jgi:hypothetical protein
MPVVRIEPPAACFVDALEDAEEVGRGLAEDAEHRYLVVRFDCSFRPRAEQVRVEWARFRAQFRTDTPDARVTTEDLHPGRVERTVKRNVALKIAPSVKFMETELALGEYSTGSDYEVIEPVIEAAGRGGDDVSWDYSSRAEESVSGAKRMHALVKVPVTAGFLDVLVEISADLRVDRGLLWAARRSEDQEPIRVRLWP